MSTCIDRVRFWKSGRVIARMAGLAPALIAASTILLPVPAMALQPAAGTAVAATSSTLEEKLARIERELEAERQKQHIPALSIAIVKDDKVIFAKGFGLRDVEKNLPAEAETVYSIGSQTKAFTSMLCAMMVDQGKISFDDTVVSRLPWFQLKTPDFTQAVTIRDALSHRTGLQRTDLLWAGGKVSRREAIEQLRFAEPFAPMRTTFLYNNLMFMTAGELAASIGGYPAWEPMVREKIIAPLGMTSTSITTAEAKKDPRLAVGYSWQEETKSFKALPVRVMDTCGPAGGIYSNVLDMSQWVRCMLRKGELDGVKLLSNTDLFEKDLWAPQNPIGNGESYGLGWMIGNFKGKKVVHHGGNIDGYACMVALLPEENLGLVLLHNTSFSALQEGCKQIVFGAMLDVPAAPAGAAAAAAIPEADLKKYEGFYRFQGDNNIKALIKDGKLALDVPGQTVYSLKWPEPDGKWTFEMTDAIKVSFKTTADGSIESMTMFQAGQEFLMPRTSGETKLAMPAEDLLKLVRGRVTGEAPKSIRITGSFNFVHQGIPGKVVLLSKGEKFAISMDMGKFGYIRTGYDGTQGWVDSDLQPSETLTGKKASELRVQNPSLLYADPSAFYAKIEPVAFEDVRGRKAIKTKLTTADGTTSMVWYDAEKGRPMKEHQEAQGDMPGAGVVDLSYTRWKRFETIEIPMKITMEPAGAGRAEMEIENVELNAEIPDAEFGPKGK